jgi:GNAT superfamily N-acetyltransferase
MKLREAIPEDIPGIQKVRNAVKENRLSDPALVPDHDVLDYITRRGRGWVAEENGTIIGFSIVSLIDKNVWALFVDPSAEKKGAGRELHDRMLDWYFSQTNAAIWLSTAPGTRAEGFYRKAGWTETGIYGKGEIKFEMSAADWKRLQH